ncbi:MAG: C40 family peptidase [Jatrophihabitans sp.]|uniref:C40 family peptidase n=1 Tax=Jatrophihabitans sp. TaxID=1932789 RepID=UPI003F80A4A1
MRRAIATASAAVALAALTACGAEVPAGAPLGAPLVAPQAATYRPAVATVVPAPMGQWTPARGQEIARRALQWLGTPYAWAGGDAGGPTRGIAVDRASRNDGHVIGFDCSGLVMYALAPWRRLTHFAATQYTQVGSFHPALDTLYPGDLVFWSKDGTIGGIGHVAVYIGDGKVVQAPHSGDVVRITPLDAVEGGTMGATRPLT